MTTPVVESAETARLAATPAPRGKPGGPGLWQHKGWKLPNYIEQVRDGIMKSGKSESQATQIAIGRVRDWAAGKGKVSAEVKAASARAIAEYEAMRAKTKGRIKEAAGYDEDALQRAADLAQERLGMLERLGHTTSGAGARSDLVLIEAAAFDPSKHPRGGTGSAAGGRFVSKGDSGSEVRAVQRRTGTRVDGTFGDATKQAVMAFQRKHGLVVDGVVGRQTVAALRGRRDAKRVRVGGLTSSDRSFLKTHVKTSGGRKRSTPIIEAAAPTALLDRVKGLEPGEHAMLPDGGAVRHHVTPDGRKVWSAGDPARWNETGISWNSARSTPEEATAEALTDSAARTAPQALGGTTRFSRWTRVTHNGRSGDFRGVNEQGQPLVRFESRSTITGKEQEPSVVSWPGLQRAPDRLVEAAFDKSKHPRRTNGKFAAKVEEIKRAHPDVHLDISHRADGSVISLVRTKDEARGKGKAGKVLSALTQAADQHGETLALHPDPIGKGGLSKPALKGFYKRHGFVPNSGRAKDYAFSETMIRSPKRK
jgi:GNAT superfamily N-acetyltransferase